MFRKGKWIWAKIPSACDVYTEYTDTFIANGKSTSLLISVDTDYTLYLNGQYVASNQYADFEHYKIYDTVDLDAFLLPGENRLQILVYYCGVDTQRYRRAEAGLIYEVISGDDILAYSNEQTLSRKSPTYVSGLLRPVSRQLGFTFTYDACRATDEGYAPSALVGKTVTFFPRPIPKQRVLKRHPITSVSVIDKNTYLIDLGEEVVGLATLDFTSECEQTLRVAYGESLDDGRVRAQIHDRNFFFEYHSRVGHNTFTNYMLRLGCRYLEVHCEYPMDIHYIGLLPEVYEVGERPCRAVGDVEQKIFEISQNTLRLCMMEHYVDTPWREQCLYAFDSRNQMLSGYYTFENQNRDYARANLILLGEDRREDGLLSICAPSGTKLAIPTFSLYYIIAMKEYAEHTGDFSLAKEYTPKIEGILNEFFGRMGEDNLIHRFSGKDFWNFYDWSEHLSGDLRRDGDTTPDLIINCLFLMAYDAYKWLAEKAGMSLPSDRRICRLRARVRECFLAECGLFSFTPHGNAFTTLGCALAILCGVANDEASLICDSIVAGRTTPSSLSMNIWKYEALLAVDEDKYREYILDEIRRNYKPMLDFGSTTVWETAEGSLAFDNAGSLCHGWSAVPIYIYHRLGLLKETDA